MRRWSLVLALAAALPAVAGGCATTEGSAGVQFGARNEIAEEHLRQQVDEMRFLHGPELLRRMAQLARMGDDAVEAVSAGTRSDDWLVRSSCHWILGAMGDRRNIETLHAGLADPVPSVRYQAADALVKLGDARGFRVLVEGLADADLQNRFKCFQTLRQTTGKDFGYRHDAAPDDRRQAVGRWLDWLDGIPPTAL